jgi:hypothetical protein
MDPNINLCPPKVKLAIEHFVVQDLSRREKAIDTAAKLAGLTPKEFRYYMRQEAVQEIVKRKLEKIDTETSKLIA